MMDRNNYLRLNPKRYEQHLSPFGKKVLNVLIKQWDTTCNQMASTNKNEIHYHQLPSQYRRNLNFSDVAVTNAPISLPKAIHRDTTNYQVPLSQSIAGHTLKLGLSDSEYLDENTANLNLVEVPAPEIPNSVEFINTVSKINDDCDDDYLHPVIVANKNVVYNIYNKDSAYKNLSHDVYHFNNMDTNRTKDINWDDMLDSELLLDMPININLETSVKSFSNVNMTKDNTALEKKVKGRQKRRIKNISDRATISKIRNEFSLISSIEKQSMSVEPGKLAIKMITDMPKQRFRKQNYTKAVKNWLVNVEPHHAIEEEMDTEEISNIDNNKNETILNVSNKVKNDHETRFNVHLVTTTYDKTTSIKKTLKAAKKVVQAQLANKDGVMKYSKPKNVEKESKTVRDVIENQPKDNKEKKVKKFVAPIKSQIPIKDVTYEIFTVNENNIEIYEDNLRDIRNNEIFVVLIYSNGFNQLNSHHTDDECAFKGVLINIGDMFYCFESFGQKLKKTLEHIIENNTIICYGARNFLINLTYVQIKINCINVYDTKIGASLLDPDNPSENFTELQKQLSFSPLYTIATECPQQKTAWYISLLKECWAKLYGMLVADSLWKVFVEIEMKLLPIITEMECRGVLIDGVKLKSMEEVLLTRMKLTEQQCYKAAGKVFQINSAVQVRAILYDELQLDTKCNLKIRETICKGAKSTAETMLRGLMSEHPLPKLILEYRHLHKAHATFLTGIAQHIKDGVVRPTWVQTAAATGRIASNNPNLQAIPKAPFSLVMFPDTGDNDNKQLIFRSVYVSRAGHSFLAADFKHVECRVFAHAAADTFLLNALTASEDLFKVLAAKWLNKPETEVVAEERERTKRLVYASLYGAGTRKLMEILDVNYQQALQVAASFNRTFPSLKSFGRGVVSRCEQSGGRLATLCGRVRRFTNIASEDFALKSHAERQAVNFIVQGSAADLCKIAMILTEERLRNASPPVDAHLILQIHDELVWEVRDHDVERAAVIIKQVMEGCGQQCGMPMTLPVATSLGKNWGEMDEYTPTI